MPRLNKQQKRWLVIELASYRAPTEIVGEFEAEFKFKISRQQAWEYKLDLPGNRAKVKDAELLELFDTVRNDFKTNVEGVKIATLAGRMDELQRLFDEAKGLKLRRRQEAILEQAAKDSGGAYTNKRDITSDGQALKGYVGFDTEAV